MAIGPSQKQGQIDLSAEQLSRSSHRSRGKASSSFSGDSEAGHLVLQEELEEEKETVILIDTFRRPQPQPELMPSRTVKQTEGKSCMLCSCSL